MCPAGAWLDPAKAEAAETLDHFVITARVLGVLIVIVAHDHLDAVVRMPADPAFDVIAVPVENTGCDCGVFLEDFAILELIA